MVESLSHCKFIRGNGDQNIISGLLALWSNIFLFASWQREKKKRVLGNWSMSIIFEIGCPTQVGHMHYSDNVNKSVLVCSWL